MTDNAKEEIQELTPEQASDMREAILTARVDNAEKMIVSLCSIVGDLIANDNGEETDFGKSFHTYVQSTLQLGGLRQDNDRYIKVDDIVSKHKH